MVSFTRPCPTCGHENPLDADFCASCNAYVRWEPTGQLPSVAPPGEDEAAAASPAAGAEEDTAAAPPPSAAEPVPPEGAQPADPRTPHGTRLYAAVHAPVVPPPESIVLTLEVPGADGPPSGRVATRVDAGGQTVLTGHVRNQSGLVDRYNLRVEGLPEGWWTITPDTVYLVPFGSAAEGYEQAVEIRLHPPRAPEAEAREWPLRVVAASTASGTDVAEAPADLDDRAVPRARQRAATRTIQRPAARQACDRGAQPRERAHRDRARGNRPRRQAPDALRAVAPAGRGRAA